MNSLHVLHVDFKMFQFSKDMYNYVMIDFLKYFIRDVMLEWLYLKFYEKVTKSSEGVYIMSSELKISVIIPIYNTAEYLSRCLDSVLNNTYQNLEVICINDGSTDLSGSICKKWGVQ